MISQDVEGSAALANLADGHAAQDGSHGPSICLQPHLLADGLGLVDREKLPQRRGAFEREGAATGAEVARVAAGTDGGMGAGSGAVAGPAAHIVWRPELPGQAVTNPSVAPGGSRPQAARAEHGAEHTHTHTLYP